MSTEYISIQSEKCVSDCFGRETRFITSTGVKSFYDFVNKDKVVVLSHKGIWRNAIVHSYGWQRLVEIDLKRATGSIKTVRVTPNHRWILKDGSETVELAIGNRLIYTPDISSFDWNSLSREDKKLWCKGFALGDGAIIIDNGIPTIHVRLCGDKNTYGPRFTDAGYTVTFPKSLKGDGYIRMIDCRTKDIPWLSLNKDNIKYYIDGLLCADGGKNKKNSSSFFRSIQVTGELNRYIYDLLNIAGHYVTNVVDMTGTKTNYGIRISETKNYGIYNNCGSRTWFVNDIRPVKLNPRAEVWCLEMEEDHSFLLEGGIPTGTC